MFSLFKRKKAPQEISREEIIKRSRIVIIDDRDFEYVDLLKKDGYTVEKWTSNDDIVIEKLEGNFFDIILLDMDGVATDRSDKHGLGLLEHIKGTNPAQIVIAYSAGSFSFSSQKFIKLADACLEKSANYYDFKKQIDEFLAKRFNVNYYEEILKKILVENGKAPDIINGMLQQAISDKKSDKVTTILGNINLTADSIQRILTIFETVIKVFS